MTTSWRLIDQRIDAQHLAGVKKARSAAREKVWAAGGAPQVGTTLTIDVDATITIDQWRRQGEFGCHVETDVRLSPVPGIDRPDISGGEALAALLPPGNAGSNTAARCAAAGAPSGRVQFTICQLLLALLPFLRGSITCSWPVSWTNGPVVVTSWPTPTPGPTTTSRVDRVAVMPGYCPMRAPR